MLSSSASAWDVAASAYDAERLRDRVYTQCLRRTTLAMRGPWRRVLDMGCGTGLTTLPLCRPGRTVVAADYSFASLRMLQSKAAITALSQANLLALPFLDGAFDAVLCGNALQHLNQRDQVTAVQELRRVVAPGGALVVTVHHYSRLKQRQGWIKEGKPGQPGIDYIFRFSHADLRALLPGAEIEAMGFPTRGERLFPRFVRRMAAKQGWGHMLLAITHP